MDTYVSGNKEAWEEAFDMRSEDWGEDIVERVKKEKFPFFEKDVVTRLEKMDLKGKNIAQFCCNNGRELLSIVKSSEAKMGVGFDIAENQVAFANEKAKELDLSCKFVATNILELDDTYKDTFDLVIITIGALCWFKDLNCFFANVAKTMKKDGVIFINEQHPCTSMLAYSDEDEYIEAHPLNPAFSYFEYEWKGNDGMYYITQKNYKSKTFTDYTHPMSEIINGMCQNGLFVTGLDEFDYDLSGSLVKENGKSYPLSMILIGKKTS